MLAVPETVTISWDKYKELVEASCELDLLYNAGVDNWDGMGEIDWDVLEEMVITELSHGGK